MRTLSSSNYFRRCCQHLFTYRDKNRGLWTSNNRNILQSVTENIRKQQQGSLEPVLKLSTLGLNNKNNMALKQKMIIDVDTGVDDAQAIMMALAQNVDVLGITCVAGNTNVDQVVTNTLRVLQACERMDVPVYKGASKSLIGGHTDAIVHHGEDGLGNKPDPNPPSHSLAQEKPAAIALIDIVNKYPGEVTLVALAPLTNIALAQRLDPKFGSKLKKAIIMGGNIKAKGRISTSAEFNFYMDVEAASVILEDIKCPKILLPYETGRESSLPVEWFEDLMNVGTKKGKFHRLINEHTYKQRKEIRKYKGYTSCDPMAMSVALDPSIALESEKQYCKVELRGELTRGQMVVDWNGILEKEPNVEIVTKVDLEKLKLLYEKMLE